MNGLVNTVALALAIGNAAQAGTGQQANAAGDNASLVTDDIAKEVACDNNAVEASRVLDQNHSSAINKLVLNLEIGELALKCLRHDLAPQAAGSQDIGLVQRPDLLVAAAAGHEASKTRNALNLGARVGLSVPSCAGAIVLLALAKVDAASQLADNDNVSAAANLGLERRSIDEGVRREKARAQVTICSHLFAQLQQTLFRADRSSTPFRAANGTEEDGIGGVGGSERFICKGASGGINRAL